MTLTFRTLAIGEKFELNGTMYIKRSTRTAKMLQYHGATFYVDQMARCKPLVQ